MVAPEGLQMTSQYSAYAFDAGLERLHALNAHAHAHAPSYPHARMHTHICTQRPTSNTYCFSTATVIRQRASLFRYTCIACRVLSCLCVCSP